MKRSWKTPIWGVPIPASSLALKRLQVLLGAARVQSHAGEHGRQGLAEQKAVDEEHNEWCGARRVQHVRTFQTILMGPGDLHIFFPGAIDRLLGRASDRACRGLCSVVGGSDAPKGAWLTGSMSNGP